MIKKIEKEIHFWIVNTLISNWIHIYHEWSDNFVGFEFDQKKNWKRDLFLNCEYWNRLPCSPRNVYKKNSKVLNKWYLIQSVLCQPILNSQNFQVRTFDNIIILFKLIWKLIWQDALQAYNKDMYDFSGFHHFINGILSDLESKWEFTHQSFGDLQILPLSTGNFFHEHFLLSLILHLNFQCCVLNLFLCCCLELNIP